MKDVAEWFATAVVAGAGEDAERRVSSIERTGAGVAEEVCVSCCDGSDKEEGEGCAAEAVTLVACTEEVESSAAGKEATRDSPLTPLTVGSHEFDSEMFNGEVARRGVWEVVEEVVEVEEAVAAVVAVAAAPVECVCGGKAGEENSSGGPNWGDEA